jgi:hypothetical protein
VEPSADSQTEVKKTRHGEQRLKDFDHDINWGFISESGTEMHPPALMLVPHFEAPRVKWPAEQKAQSSLRSIDHNLELGADGVFKLGTVLPAVHYSDVDAAPKARCSNIILAQKNKSIKVLCLCPVCLPPFDAGGGSSWSRAWDRLRAEIPAVNRVVMPRLISSNTCHAVLLRPNLPPPPPASRLAAPEEPKRVRPNAVPLKSQQIATCLTACSPSKAASKRMF